MTVLLINLGQSLCLSKPKCGICPLRDVCASSTKKTYKSVDREVINLEYDDDCEHPEPDTLDTAAAAPEADAAGAAEARDIPEDAGVAGDAIFETVEDMPVDVNKKRKRAFFRSLSYDGSFQ